MREGEQGTSTRIGWCATSMAHLGVQATAGEALPQIRDSLPLHAHLRGQHVVSHLTRSVHNRASPALRAMLFMQHKMPSEWPSSVHEISRHCPETNSPCCLAKLF